MYINIIPSIYSPNTAATFLLLRRLPSYNDTSESTCVHLITNSITPYLCNVNILPKHVGVTCPKYDKCELPLFVIHSPWTSATNMNTSEMLSYHHRSTLSLVQYVNNMELPEITPSLVSSQAAPRIAEDNWMTSWCKVKGSSKNSENGLYENVCWWFQLPVPCKCTLLLLK